MRRIAKSTLERAAIRRPAGYLDDVYANAAEVTDTHAILSDEAWERLYAKYSPHYVDQRRGPGTELKKLLGRLGFHATSQCACNKHASQMNDWGPDVCLQRIEEIIQWLREAAAARGLPFLEPVARLVVHRAIKSSRRG